MPLAKADEFEKVKSHGTQAAVTGGSRRGFHEAGFPAMPGPRAVVVPEGRIRILRATRRDLTLTADRIALPRKRHVFTAQAVKDAKPFPEKPAAGGGEGKIARA
jgi:hypothetical protein